MVVCFFSRVKEGKATVFNRYKPERCNFYFGGKHQSQPKQPKPYAPNCVFLFSLEGFSFFSVKADCDELSSTSSSGPSGSHYLFPPPSYQQGLSFVVKAPHGINSAVPSISKAALSSSANCVAPMMPNHIPLVLHRHMPLLNPLLSPLWVYFSCPLQLLFITHHKVLFHMNLPKSLPKSTESEMHTSTVKINLQHELPSHILMRIQEIYSKFISLVLGGDCWPKGYSPTPKLCVMWCYTWGFASTPWTKGRRVRLSYYQLPSSGAMWKV